MQHLILANAVTTTLTWLVILAVLGYALVLVSSYVGMMKTIYLSFELGLTIVWYWAAIWQFSLVHHPQSDGGTFIGGLLFLVFGVLTSWMLCTEIIKTVREQFNFELNLFRRYKLMEKLAQRTPERPAHAQDLPLNLPPQE
jgi:hypothetical protein